MIRAFLLSIVVGCGSAGFACAGVGSWAVDVESDPFSKGQTIIAFQATSLRSAVLIMCTTAGAGLRVRIVPGYSYPEGELDASKVSALVTKDAAFAFDGEVANLSLADASLSIVGENQLAVDLILDAASAERFVDAFSKARSEISIKDGLSNSHHVLSANGSMSAAERLEACVNSQR